MKYTRKKWVPVSFGFDGNNYEQDKFYCYFEEATWNKYGLHYVLHDSTGSLEYVHLKGKRYSKPPYAFNSYDEMMKMTEKYARAKYAADNIRKDAVYLLLDLDDNGRLLSDPFDFKGYVSQRGTIFHITGDGFHNGEKSFILTQKDKHLVFSDIAKAARYVDEHYGWWACTHYLKNALEDVVFDN